jgi:formiminotetrahydrofolate cyclodeaminase
VAALCAESAAASAGYNVEANLTADADPALVSSAEPRMKELSEKTRGHAVRIGKHVAASLAKMRAPK